jgi:hypothetical protein
MPDQLGSAVLELSTDSAKVVAGLNDLKAQIKSVGDTVGQTSNASANDWSDLGRAIAAVSKQLAEQKTHTEDLRNGAHGLSAEMHSLVDLGKEVAGALGIAFGIDAAVEYGRRILEDASNLKNLSAQTQVSIGDLQLLTAATEGYNVSGEELGKALFQLKQRIAGGDDSIATAYHLMGLSIDDVRNKNAVELFLTTERGLNTLTGAIKDTAAADLYGPKLGSQLVAFSTGVDEAIKHARELNHVASDESVKALADYEEAIKSAKRAVDSWVTEQAGQAAQGFNVLVDAANRGASKWQIFTAMLKDFASSSIATGANTSHLATLLDQLNQQTERNTAAAHGNADANRDMADAHGKNLHALTAEEQAARFMAASRADAIKPLLEWQKKDLDQLEQIGALNEKNAAAIGVTASQFDKYKAGLEAQKKFIDGWTNLNALGQTYEATLASLDPALRAQVEYYAQLGASVEQLTGAFPALAASQAKAAVDAAQQVKQAQKVSLEETTRLWDEYTEVVIQHTGTSTQVQIAAVDRWAADLTARVQKAGADTAEFYDALAAVTSEKLRAMLVDWKSISDSSAAVWKQNLQDTATKAAATYQYMVEHAEQFRADTIEKFKDIADQAAIAADDWYTSWSDHLDQLDQKIDQSDQKVKQIASDAAAAAAAASGTLPSASDASTSSQTDPLVKSMLASGYTLNEALAIAGGYGAAINIGRTPSHRAGGGPVSAGMPYIVGEKRAELFVPDRNGTILPSAGGGGVTVVQNITHPLGTPAQIASVVRRALEDGLRSTGARI